MPDEVLANLEKRHPLWTKNKEFWAEITDVLHDGIRHNKEKYIAKGEEEDQADYELRLKMARFKGETASLIHRTVGASYSMPPTRDRKFLSKWASVIANCNMRGKTFDFFNQDRLFNALGYGAEAVLVESPRTNPNGQVVADTSKEFRSVPSVRMSGANEIKLTPFRIDQIVNWYCDDNGELHWLRTYSEYTRQLTPDSPEEEVGVYREWDRQSWRVFEVQKGDGGEKKAVLMDQGDHNLGIVPFAFLVPHEGDSPMDFESPVKYIYHYDIDIFTDWADLKWDTWRHAHPTLKDSRSKEGAAPKVPIGANARIDLERPEDIFEYVKYPSEASDQLRKNIAAAIHGMKRLAGHDPLGASDNPQALGASGLARTESFIIGEGRFLQRYSTALSSYEKRVFEIAERWGNTREDIPPEEEVNEFVTTYASEFTTTAIESLIESWRKTRAEINSEVYDRSMQRKIVSVLLRDMGPEDRRKMLKEIENNEILSPINEAGDPIPVKPKAEKFEEDEPKPAPQLPGKIESAPLQVEEMTSADLEK